MMKVAQNANISENTETLTDCLTREIFYAIATGNTNVSMRADTYCQKSVKVCHGSYEKGDNNIAVNLCKVNINLGEAFKPTTQDPKYLFHIANVAENVQYNNENSLEQNLVELNNALPKLCTLINDATKPILVYDIISMWKDSDYLEPYMDKFFDLMNLMYKDQQPTFKQRLDQAMSYLIDLHERYDDVVYDATNTTVITPGLRSVIVPYKSDKNNKQPPPKVVGGGMKYSPTTKRCNINGTNKIIYKLQGSRKQYVKYNGKYIEYTKLVSK